MRNPPILHRTRCETLGRSCSPGDARGAKGEEFSRIVDGFRIHASANVADWLRSRLAAAPTDNLLFKTHLSDFGQQAGVVAVFLVQRAA